MSVTVNSAEHRAMLQTLGEDADDVDDGGCWFQQHGVIAHAALESVDVLRDVFLGRIISCFGKT